MSDSPAYHHRPGEFCTDLRRVWHDDETGLVNPGPWPPEIPMRLSEGHWVCPGHDGQGLGSGPGA